MHKNRMDLCNREYLVSKSQSKGCTLRCVDNYRFHKCYFLLPGQTVAEQRIWSDWIPVFFPKRWHTNNPALSCCTIQIKADLVTIPETIATLDINQLKKWEAAEKSGQWEQFKNLLVAIKHSPWRYVTLVHSPLLTAHSKLIHLTWKTWRVGSRTVRPRWPLTYHSILQ